MINFRTLAHEVATPHGIYTAGLQVVALDELEPGAVRICLDPPGTHRAARCHAATVPAAWLTGNPYRDTARKERAS